MIKKYLHERVLRIFLRNYTAGATILKKCIAKREVLARFKSPKRRSRVSNPFHFRIGNFPIGVIDITVPTSLSGVNRFHIAMISAGPTDKFLCRGLSIAKLTR
jgi:hypothetical protein